MSNVKKTYTAETLAAKLFRDDYCTAMFAGVLPAFDSEAKLRADIERRLDAGTYANPHTLIQEYEVEGARL